VAHFGPERWLSLARNNQ